MKLWLARNQVGVINESTLVHILLNPPLAPSRRKERIKLWRDAGDVVQLLRLTGGRLNEIVRLRLEQFIWAKGKLRLYATKTENQRDLPLWECINAVVQRRISEGLTDGELLFPRAKTATFDNAIARAWQGRESGRSELWTDEWLHLSQSPAYLYH